MDYNLQTFKKCPYDGTVLELNPNVLDFQELNEKEKELLNNNSNENITGGFNDYNYNNFNEGFIPIEQSNNTNLQEIEDENIKKTYDNLWRLTDSSKPITKKSISTLTIDNVITHPHWRELTDEQKRKIWMAFKNKNTKITGGKRGKKKKEDNNENVQNNNNQNINNNFLTPQDFLNIENQNQGNNYITISKKFAICPTCNFSYELKEPTEFFSINLEKAEVKPLDIKSLIYDNTLASTRIYNCNNEQCPTNNPNSNPWEKLAKFYKDEEGNPYTICTVCWTANKESYN